MPLTGGTFTGPELNGKLLPGSSADWQIVLPDGTALGDIRYTLQTDDGDLLYVQSRGVRHGSADVLARLARGEDVDASEYTFRTSTQIETAAPALDWLNKGVFISVGGRQPGGVDLRDLPGRMNATKKENKMPPIVSRGFRGRRAADVDPARVPPGQYVTADFPVLSAGPTPHTALELWDFSIIGELDEPRRWTLGGVPCPPERGNHPRHPLRDQVVEARHRLARRLGRHAARGDRDASRST